MVRSDGTAAGRIVERVGRASPALVFAAILIGLVAPRGSVVALICVVTALVSAATMVLDRRWLELFRPPTAAVATLAALGLYLLLNAAWSVTRSEAYGKVAFYFFACGLVVIGTAVVHRLGTETLSRLATAMAGAACLGLAYLMIEVLLDQPIARLVTTLLPFIRPDPKHAKVVDGQVVSIGDYMLNRNLAVLCLVIFPVALAARTVLARKYWQVMVAVAFTAAAVTVFNSAHETSMLALTFAGVTFIGASLVPVLWRRLVVVGWLTATLLVVPLALAGYGAGLHQARWIPETGRNRIILWGFTAAEVRKAPIFGVGVASTRDLDARASTSATKPDGYSYPLRTGRHSHNIFMQAWYELGAIGATLLSVLGLAVLSLVRRLPRGQLPYGYATFVAAVIIGCFSWGLWQTWFLAAFGFCAVLLAISLEIAERHEQVQTSAESQRSP